MTSSTSFEAMVPRQDSIAKLLVLTARAALTENQKSEARELAARIDDWLEFTDLAVKKFSITFAYKHLRNIAPDLVSSAQMQVMRRHARAFGRAALRIAAAQVAFHNTCIVPNRATHAYIKGAALSHQFGRNFSDRLSRDIDILVAEQDFKNVIESALHSGYRLLLSGDPFRYATTPADFEFAIRYMTVVMLVGEDEILIEVHRRLGKTSFSFDLNDAFRSSEKIELAGVPMMTLAKPLHFVYICYHHSRHFWSHLHWLSDLDAMAVSPLLDRDEVERIADKLGIKETTNAVFEFHELTSRPAKWDGLNLSADGGCQFLKACLVNLDGGLELEKSIREHRALGEFISDWQFEEQRLASFTKNSWIHRLRPRIEQHYVRHYSKSFFWLYRVENTFELAKQGIKRAFKRARIKQLDNLDDRAGKESSENRIQKL